MQIINIPDHLYQEAKRRATEAGYANVDEYLNEFISGGFKEENFDHLFTPERLAHLDRISAGIKAGEKTYTMDEVRAHFEKTEKTWPQQPES